VKLLSPIVIALALAIVTLPLTILAVMSVVGKSPVSYDGIVHLSLEEALICSVGAVVCGALVGGAIGGWRVRLRPLTGAFLALVAAWPAAVIGFTILPSIVGRPTSFGRTCMDGCSEALALGSPRSVATAVERYGQSLALGWWLWFVVWGPLVVVAIVIASKPRSVPVRIVGFVAAAIAFGLMNVFSVGASGWSYAILVGGVLAWSWILTRLARTPMGDSPDVL
jgi:hypothetical protein